jgi:hypothetical protein
VAIPAPAAPAQINMITNYGQVTLQQVRACAAVYMAVQEQLNQQSLMLYDFLSDSIDNTALATLNIQPGNFTVLGNTEGACFLKEIITKSYVDTNATVDTILRMISRLDDRIKELKFDIKAFNECMGPGQFIKGSWSPMYGVADKCLLGVQAGSRCRICTASGVFLLPIYEWHFGWCNPRRPGKTSYAHDGTKLSSLTNRRNMGAKRGEN